MGMPDISSLFEQIKSFQEQPVDDWHPEKTVAIDLEVDATGRWLYQGSGFQRHSIVKLFSTVLRREGEEFFLVTPPVKYLIKVADAPFLAVELKVVEDNDQQSLFFRTNMDEVVCADAQHPIFTSPSRDGTGEYPYIEVRDGLLARIVRPVYYQLAEMVDETAGGFRIRSANTDFILG